MARKAGEGIPQFASLYVGDLKLEVTEAQLYEIFNSVGPVASIRICRDSVKRVSLGYGYVNFHSVADAERALDTLNYSSIKGRSCRIMWSQRDPALRKSGAGNIYVKNLDKNIDNKALYDTFSLFGNILSCKVASDANGNSYGYGFVHYETEEAATQSIERVNNMQIGEKTVQVCVFENQKDRGPGDVDSYTNLYIKSFPADWDDARLHALFQEVGPVTAAAVRTDNRGRCFAFVNFERHEDAKKAVETLNKRDMRSEEDITAEKDAGKEPELDADGHPVHGLYVGRAQTKAERQEELRKKFSDPTGTSQGVNLYVKNLDTETTDVGLREMFEPFGEVQSVSAPRDDNGKCKGFGFVCFSSPDEATKAVTEMHLKVLGGKPLYVGLAEKREDRQERLRNRYDPAAGGGGKKGGKGKGGQKGQGMPQPGMFGGYGQPMQPPPGGMMGGMPSMFGKGGMPPMMGGMPMMGGKGPMLGPGGMPMMGGPQMMANMMGAKGGMAQAMQMMGKGGMPGMMPPMPMGMKGQMGMGRPMPQQMPGQPPAAPNAPLNASVLANAPPAVQKQMIGEKLFPAINKIKPDLAGKITGMMLEMDNSELLMLLESDQQLKQKVDEAVMVLTATK